MSELEFVCRGQVTTAQVVRNISDKPKPKAAPLPRDPKHLGFVVYGYPCGRIAEARRLACDAIERWSVMSDEARKAAIKSGEREPRAWDEGEWLATHKPRQISKAYATSEAADTFAELAIKAGYEHVYSAAKTQGKQ